MKNHPRSYSHNLRRTAMRRTAALIAAAALSLGACGDGEQDPESFPDRNITLTVPFGTGGSTDPLARAFAVQMEQVSDTTIVVENVPGGGGAIGTQRMLDQEPDGYSIGLSSSSILGFQPVMQSDLTFEDPTSWEPIIRLGIQPTIMVAPADAPYNNWEDFLEYAREHPSEVTAGHTGLNTLNEVSIRELNAAADVDIVGVPFSGGSEYIPALLGGRVSVVATYYAGVAGEIEAGRMKIIGCFCDDPPAMLSDIQTIGDAGYPGIGFSAHNYLIAPAGVPEDIVERVRELAEEAWNTDAFQEFRDNNGFGGEMVRPETVRDEVVDFRERFVTLNEETGQT